MSALKPQNKRRQLARRWLPLFYKPSSSQPRRHTTRGKRQLVLPLFSKELVISFSTRPKRSKRARPPKELSIRVFSKELAIILFAPKSKFKQRRRPRPLVIAFSKQAVLTLSLVLIGLVGSLYFGFRIADADSIPFTATQTSDAPPVPITIDVGPPKLPRSDPQAIRIPAIGVNSGFISLGKQADGTMETPASYDIAGWYKYAPTPGEIGPAVVVGHVDSYMGAAVFYRLGQLKAGDVVEVDRADKTTVKFKVEAVKQFPQDSFPTAEVYGNIDYAGLRLITCGGFFNNSTRQYSHNTVVFASIIE